MPKLVIVCPSYQDILELTLFCIYSERNQGKSNILIAEIWNFCHFCVQNEWKHVRRWHHHLTHLHIHIDWSRNVSWKICETLKCHNLLIFQPIFIRFSLLCLKFFTLSSEIKLNLLWSSSLILLEKLPFIVSFSAMRPRHRQNNHPPIMYFKRKSLQLIICFLYVQFGAL